MNTNKKSALTAGTVKGANTKTLHIDDSTETEEMQEFFKLARTLEPKYWALLLLEARKMVKRNKIQRARRGEVGTAHD